MLQKILLTGSTGMVGKNILEHTSQKQYTFLTPTSKELNLLDLKEVQDFFQKNDIDLVIHSAGLVGGIQANIAQPVRFLVENMYMGINLINAAYQNGVKKFLNISSSCMYPRNAQNPLVESLILQGGLEPTNEGYALAKVTSTRLCEYIQHESPEYLYKTIIPCNLYGRHDKFDPKNSHMIPAVIRKLFHAKKMNQKTVDIWGSGEARREFMYASDLADFVFFALNNFEKIPQNLNVGIGHDYSINEYYDVIASVIGYKGSFVHDMSKPVGMKQKLIDDTRLKKFGWSYKTSLQDGVKQTFEFYKEIGL